MVCPKCGSNDIAISTFKESKSAGCLTVLFYIFLAITILGLLIVIPLLLRGKREKIVTLCVCKNCGYKWKI